MKGRTWCIGFQDDAKKDGDVQLKYLVTDAQGKPDEIEGVWEGYKAGDTAEMKATRFFNALKSPPYNALVRVARAGTTVCFQLKDNAPYQDINGIQVGDQTGQTFNVYDDLDPEVFTDPLETVRFRLEGFAASSHGEVRLGIGRVDRMARVATHEAGEPLSTSTILEALVEHFNAIYTHLGYEAHLEDDEVIIPKVPCKLGTRGGSDDTGFNYWLSMADPDVGPFSRTFDKPRILLDAVRLNSARLDLAGIPRATFADPELSCFVQDFGELPVFQCGTPQANDCQTSVDITSIPGRIPAGTKSIAVKVKVTAQLKPLPPGTKVRPLSDCIVYVLVEKIDNTPGIEKVVDQRLTSKTVTTPAKDKVINISADSDMTLVTGNGVRVTVTLISTECKPVAVGPRLINVT